MSSVSTKTDAEVWERIERILETIPLTENQAIVRTWFLVDAFLLDSLPKSYMPPKDVRELRRLARHPAFLANEKIRLKQRIHAIRKRKGVKISDPKTNDDATDIFLLRLRKELLRVEDPEVPITLDLIDVFQKRIDAAERRMIHEIDARPDAKLIG